MSLFDWLLVGHLAGDFLLQTEGMARNKTQSWSWMLKHIGFYMAVMTVSIAAYALSHPLPLWLIVVALLLIGGTHMLLDRRGFTLRWMRLVGVSVDHAWLPIVMDQVFHLVVLALVAQILTTVGG
jgi:hypothetical protein